jgi:hypothetical protein
MRRSTLETKHEAKRYSGEVRIYLAYSDKYNSWQASVNTKDGRRVVFIDCRNWIKQGKAVDTKEAWEQAAHTALSFSCYDDETLSGDMDIQTSKWMSYDDVGNPHVGRTFATAFWKTAKQ